MEARLLKTIQLALSFSLRYVYPRMNAIDMIPRQNYSRSRSAHPVLSLFLKARRSLYHSKVLLGMVSQHLIHRRERKIVASNAH